jgi:hypothetical protein
MISWFQRLSFKWVNQHRYGAVREGVPFYVSANNVVGRCTLNAVDPQLESDLVSNPYP